MGDTVETQDKYAVTLDGGSVVEAIKGEPRLQLGKWGGAVDLGIQYDRIAAVASIDAKDGRYKWEGPKEEFHAYQLPASEGMEDGGFEVEIVVKETPASNRFPLILTGAEYLNFFPQPPLTDEEIKQGAIRPEHIVDSLAIYHQQLAHYKLGGTNYGPGKVGNLHRPFVEDAKGNRAWCQWTQSKSLLEVIVPEDFIQAAVLPFRIGPTFGYTGIGASRLERSSGRIDGGKFTLTETGTIQSISIYGGDTGGTSKRVRMAVYTSAATRAYQAETAGLTSPDYNSPAWRTDNTTTTPSLSAADYYLYFNDDNDFYISYDASAGVTEYGGALTYGNSWPSTVTGSFAGTEKFSLYATYTVSSSFTYPQLERGIRGLNRGLCVGMN